MTALVLSLYTETPLHAGTGQSTGIIDLPVQREQHTRFPIIPATSLKGSLRQVATRRWEQENQLVNVLFGSEAQPGGSLHAGALAFTDARLLAFPVRSLSEVFLWTTCPLALSRLARDLRLAGITPTYPDLTKANPAQGQMAVADGLTGTIVLEDLSFQATPMPEWAELAQWLSTFLPAGEAHHVYRQKFARHLVLVDDSSFGYLVQNATQITARVVLNDANKTSENLWYEETLPSDSLFTALVLPDRPHVTNSSMTSAAAVQARFMDLVKGEPFFLQVGGNETVGNGWCALHMPAQGDTVHD